MNTRALQNRLVGWFKKNGRDLPWRRERTPYRTWISEMMLQQTQVKTMLPYFDAWMKAFPSIEALHRASMEEVLLRWQGLGYYARARNIKKCAQTLIERHGGRLPADYAALQELPGIGPYSAGAIASIGFNLKAPIVDGNVLRVLARLYAIEDPIDLPATRQKIQKLQTTLVPSRDPGAFNEGLMELGALVCTPQNPQCTACPLTTLCAARQTGKTEELPRRAQIKTITKVRAWAAILIHENRIFVHRRPEGKIMGGLWEFPEEKWNPGEEPSVRGELRAVAGRLGLEEKSVEKLFVLKRHYTRFAESMSVFLARLKKPAVDERIHRGWESRWLQKNELDRVPLTSAHARIRSKVASLS